DRNGGFRARNREMEEAPPWTGHGWQPGRKKLSGKGRVRRYHGHGARSRCARRRAYHVDGKGLCQGSAVGRFQEEFGQGRRGRRKIGVPSEVPIDSRAARDESEASGMEHETALPLSEEHRNPLIGQRGDQTCRSMGKQAPEAAAAVEPET